MKESFIINWKKDAFNGAVYLTVCTTLPQSYLATYKYINLAN